MKFDVPTVMMLGVVGLGAFAVFRMTKTKSSDQPTGAELKLVPGQHYQGRLTLETLDVPPLASTREQLVQFLQLLGFRNVSVYMTAKELPRSWTELRTGDSSHRWFEGTGTVSVSIPRPKQLDRLSGNGAALISGMTG